MDATLGTEYHGLDNDWAWKHICKLWPEKITLTTVNQKESICNEQITYTKAELWYTCNKQTLVDNRLDIYIPMRLIDMIYAQITINEEEKKWVINFDETDRPVLTTNEKEESRATRWVYASLDKGTEKGTRGLRHTI